MPTKPKPKTNNRKAFQRRVIGYVRISVDRDEQTSTRLQEEAIQAYCAAHGYLLVDTIIERGRSAFGTSRSNRPGFKRAMQMVKAGAADTFIVWKLDRAARNTADLLDFVEELDGQGAQFVSVTENFDTTTPMGKAMLTIIAALAEMESAQKAERAMMWHEDRRQRGLVPSGRAPFGYIKVGRNDLTIDPIKARMVVGAASMVMAGQSISAVLQWFESEGHKMSRPGLMTLLLSPTIAGLRSDVPLDVQGGIRLVPDHATLTPGVWEPIIQPEAWHELRAILRDPSRRTSPGTALRWPLVPVLRCGVCGGKMLRQCQKGRVPRYLCRGVLEGPGARCLNGIGQGPLDAEVNKAVLDALDDGAWRALRAGRELSGPDPAVIEANLAELWKGVLSHDVPVEDYVAAKAQWRAETMVSDIPVTLPDVKSIREDWDRLTPLEQSVVYQRAIKSLVIHPSKRQGRGVDISRIELVLAD